MPPGTCSRLITFRFAARSVGDLAGLQHHGVLETWPDSVVASSFTVTWMSSPGNRIAQLLLKRASPALDDEVVLDAASVGPR